jgi:phosphopantothenoylcysteine decarboxylase / phosphopantothenate---cysteine ligase
MAAERTVVLGVTASIAIYKACDLVRSLRKAGVRVLVVMTPEAEKLIRPVVFQSLSGNKVYGAMFDEPEGWEIGHVALAEAAQLVLVAPATAHILAKVRAGLCDDLVSCVICATKAPVVFCPAMNEHMYRNKIVQRNIRELRSLGYHFVNPKEGLLACGKTGTGCLADIETIVKAVKAYCG